MGFLSVAKYFFGLPVIPNYADSCLYVCQVHPGCWIHGRDFQSYISDVYAGGSIHYKEGLLKPPVIKKIV